MTIVLIDINTMHTAEKINSKKIEKLIFPKFNE